MSLAIPASATAKLCTYKDPDFGVHVHSLDIDRVQVTWLQGDGLLTFRMEFTEPYQLNDDMGFQVALDTDSDTSTGDDAGDDYSFVFVKDDNETPTLGTWADGAWTTRESGSLRFLNDNKSATFTLDAHEVSDGVHKLTTKNPPSFSFWVLAGTNWTTDEADIDQAPQREHVVVSADSGKWTFPACGYDALGTPADDSWLSLIVHQMRGYALGVGMLALIAMPIALIGVIQRRQKRRRAGL